MAIVDRARKLDPENAKVECRAAQLLTLGELYEEARAAIARFHRISGGKENPFQKNVEELQRILDEKKKAGARGRKRTGVATVAEEGGPGERSERLEEQVERFPTSIPLYEELARALCFEGRFEVALTWTSRAIGRCLSRQGQLRARALELEVTGLAALAGHAGQHGGSPQPSAVNAEAARVYLAGSRAAALEAIEAHGGALEKEHGELPYAVEYLRGVCLLAAKRRDEAQAAFRAALARCPQQLYRAVLRPLAEDVEVALLEQSRRAIEQAQEEGRLGDAMAEIAAAMGELRAPEGVPARSRARRARFGGGHPGYGRRPAAAPGGRAHGAVGPAPRRDPGGARRPPPRARARDARRRPAQKGRGGTPMPCCARWTRSRRSSRSPRRSPSRRSSPSKAGWRRRSPPSTTPSPTGRAPRSRPPALSDPRVERQRVLLLLRLERFDEADAIVERLRGHDDARAREMVDRYPELRFRFQLSVANRLVRGGDGAAARALLGAMQPATPEQTLEHGYCLAFCLAQGRLSAGRRGRPRRCARS